MNAESFKEKFVAHLKAHFPGEMLEISHGSNYNQKAFLSVQELNTDNLTSAISKFFDCATFCMANVASLRDKNMINYMKAKMEYLAFKEQLARFSAQASEERTRLAELNNEMHDLLISKQEWFEQKVKLSSDIYDVGESGVLEQKLANAEEEQKALQYEIDTLRTSLSKFEKLEEDVRQSMKPLEYASELQEDMSDTQFVEVFKKHHERSTQAIDVRKRAWLFLDIDLCDHYMVLQEQLEHPTHNQKEQFTCVKTDTGYILKRGDSNLVLENANIISREVFKSWLLPRRYEDKVLLLDFLVGLEKLWIETTPDIIVFSGNGLHVWYALDAALELNPDLYAHLFRLMADKVKATCGTRIVIDEQCQNPNRGMRMPFTLNLKGGASTPCFPLYIREEIGVQSKLLNEVVVSIMQNPQHPLRGALRSGTRGTSTRPHAFDLFGTLAKSDKKPVYLGLSNIQRDNRQFWFVRNFLTMDYMSSYLNISLENLGESNEEGYIKCSSPLREDKNPSFSFNDLTLSCKDFARADGTMDYGIFMARALDMKKEQLGMQEHIPTSRYEAELHCIFCAYIKYMREPDYIKNKSWENLIWPGPVPAPKENKKKGEGEEVNPDMFRDKAKEDAKSARFPKFPFTLQRDTTGKVVKVQGAEYYDSLLYLIESLYSVIKKGASEGLTRDEILRKLIEETPKVYLFYDYEAGRQDNAPASSNSVAALAIIHMLRRNRPVIRIVNGAIEVYKLREGIHSPWVLHYDYRVSGEQKQAHIAKINMTINAINASTLKLPQNSMGRLPQTIYSVYANFHLLDGMLQTITQEHATITEPLLTRLLSSHIKSMFEGVYVSPKDMCITLVNADRYIYFKNGFLLYDSADINSIGIFIPYSRDRYWELLSKSLIDIRVPHVYEEGPTPLWDKTIAFMDHDGNNFRKILNYFLGSVLYPPHGATRAVMLYGASGGNGKSVVADTVKNLFTEANVSDKQMADITATGMEGKQSRLALVGKILNISADTQVTEFGTYYKHLVTGDPVTVKKLYEDEVTVKPRAHHLINLNRIPKISAGENNPFVRRSLIVPLNRKVPATEMDTKLVDKIAATELGRIWFQLIQCAKIYRKHDIGGFLTEKEIECSSTLLLSANDLYTFVQECVQPGSVTNPLNKSRFKAVYNEYRRAFGRTDVKTDLVIEEAEFFIKQKFEKDPSFNAEMFTKGFEYRGSGSTRGLPVRILVPRSMTGLDYDIDSMVDKRDIH